MFGLTNSIKKTNLNPASIDTSKWKTFSSADLALQMKYPDNFIVTKSPYPGDPNAGDQYASYIFSNQQLADRNLNKEDKDSAAKQSQGLSTLSVEKAFINSTNNARGIIAVVPEDAKEDIEKFVVAWSQEKNFSVQEINGIQMIKTKPYECNLFGKHVEARGTCSNVYFKATDKNYYNIKIFVNAYDEASASIFDKMVTTISLL